MIPLSYRSPKTEVRESPIHGRGLFATAPIAKGEVVAVKGGHIINREQLREITPNAWSSGNSDRRRSFHCAGHVRKNEKLRCSTVIIPAMRISVCAAKLRLLRLRDIQAGEELTHDWCVTDDDDYSVECKCGSPKCRHTLTGKDWQRPELQKRYAGYFSAYLAKKMRA